MEKERKDCIVCGDGRSTKIYEDLEYPKDPSSFGLYKMRRCDSCKLLYVYPCPDASVLERLYSDRKYRADDLVTLTPRECMVGMDVLCRIQRLLRPGRVLDMGCGAGHFLNCMRQAGWQVYGVEIAPHSAEFARVEYGLHVMRTLEALEQPRESFDLVTLLGVIEHVEQPVEFLQRLHSFVKPGGMVFVLTDNHRSWMHWMMKDQFPWIIPPEHLQLFTPHAISVLLRHAGFEVAKIESKETIFPDAAVRGVAKLLGSRRKEKAVNPILESVAVPVLWATYPVRWLLWQANLGAQLYCFGRKPDRDQVM